MCRTPCCLTEGPTCPPGCNFIKEMNEICEFICTRLEKSDYPHLIDGIRQLQSGSKEVASWAHEYDFNGIKANGYWSLLRIGIKLGHLLVDRYKNVDKPVIDKNLINLLEYALIALDVLRILRNDSLEAANGNTNEVKLQASSLSHFVDLFGLLLSIDNEKIGSAYGAFCGFWLCKRSRYATILFVSSLSFLSAGITDGVRCLVDSQHRGLVFAELIKKADIPFVTRLRTIIESPFYKYALPALIYGVYPRIRTNLYSPRQNDWIISPLNRKVMRFMETSESLPDSRKETVRVRVLQATPSDNSHHGKIIIYCHGGGFTMGTPESQEVFLRDWANKLNGIPILSIDYTLSPEGKFPKALQEVLDVYLWVTSGPEEICKFTGSKPDQVILVGDSAGGNLCTALTMVLADIQKRDPNYPITLPKSLVTLYAPFNITLLLSPSMVLASCDSLLSAGVMLSCFEAYLPVIDDDHHNHHHNLPHQSSNNHSNSHQTSHSSSNHNNHSETNGDLSVANRDALDTLTSLFGSDGDIVLKEVLKKMLKYLRDLTSVRSPSDPWYRAEKNRLRSRIDQLYKITSNPYISPLYYDDFESLKSIDLHMIALHYDPFLDDNVTMAKQWKGKVTLDVIDELQHGFLNFMPVINEARDASDLCVERIKEAFA